MAGPGRGVRYNCGSSRRASPALIDVIIPVYRGLPETRRCLESVMRSRLALPHEIVVVDDASPEPALAAWLRELAKAGRITLLAHERNAGFVASVNDGMRAHPDRDVVLLNADTEVADGWLDRLAACAAREPHAGTVTPFSNNATICSYPRFAQPNALPPGTAAAALDALFARTNAGLSVDVPVGVGFCLFVRRACLDEVGAFDEAAFGRGYGEEVDFCLRATKAGWRHLLAADTFVFHEGEVSFGAGADEGKRNAQRLIDERHPEFQPRLADFLAREPARPLRRAVDLERLRLDPRPRLLFVTHGWEGGVRKHVEELAALLAGDANVLLLAPSEGGAVSLRWQRTGEEFEAFFEPETDWDLLVDLLRSLGLARVHFHHTHHLPEAVLDLPARLGKPFDITLHDYLPVCPQHNLGTASGRYCGEPDEAGCNRCLAGRPPVWPMDITAWRERFGRWLRAADRVIAPSRDLADRLSRYHPGLGIQVWSHPEGTAPAPSPVVRVLLLGGLSEIKGLGVLEACLRDAAARALPLHFRVVGHLERPLPDWPGVPLSIAGSYPEGRLPELLAIERGDVAFFPAQWPETYSYTLSAALEAGLPVVASDIGAFRERLAGRARTRLLAWDASAADFNDALLAAANSPANKPVSAAA